MRFRVLFAVFNAVILLSFVLIFLMPALVLGWDYTSVFWGSNWPLGGAFALVLVILNVYFVSNWKVFTLLEEEDWEGIVAYLEPQILEEDKATTQRTRILLNAYIASRQVSRIDHLAVHLRTAKPRISNALVLELGVPRLLGENGPSLLDEFTERVNAERVSHPVWVRWCYAVCLLLNDRLDDARDELIVVAGESKDTLLLLLAASMLVPYAAANEQAKSVVEQVRSDVTTRLPRERAERLLERERQRLHIVILGNQIEQAIDWAYGSRDKEKVD